jgi:hypothetical protein
MTRLWQKRVSSTQTRRQEGVKAREHKVGLVGGTQHLMPTVDWWAMGTAIRKIVALAQEGGGRI